MTYPNVLSGEGPLVGQPLVAAVKAKAARLANVERLRFIAMLEIVRFHDHDDRLPFVGGLGLPTFLLLTATFNCTLTEKRGLGRFLQDKRERLFVPWLFWSALYGALLLFGAWKRGQPMAQALHWDMILAGTSAHLWFVPFAMASALVVGFAQYFTRGVPDRLMGYLGLALGCCVLVRIANIDDAGLAAPIPQWLLSTPSAIYGFSIGRLLLANGGRLGVRQALPIVIAAVPLILLCTVSHWEFLVWRYAISLCVVAISFVIPGKVDALSKWLSPLLFGIYLAHHFVGDHLLVKVPGVDREFQGFFVLDFACTALFVWLLRRTALKRFV